MAADLCRPCLQGGPEDNKWRRCLLHVIVEEGHTNILPLIPDPQQDEGSIAPKPARTLLIPANFLKQAASDTGRIFTCTTASHKVESLLQLSMSPGTPHSNADPTFLAALGNFGGPEPK